MKRYFKPIAFIIILTLMFPIAAFGATKIPDSRSIALYKIDGSADGVSITRGPSKTFKGAVGTKIAANDTITTDGKTKAYLSIDDDKVVLLDKNTKVTISKASSSKLRVTLVSGSVYFDVKKPVPDGNSIEFKTGGTVMGVRGTDGFMMNEDGEAKVAILSGGVELKAANGQTIVVAGGQIQIMNADGIPQGAPQNIDLQTLPSFVLETIVLKLTEAPVNAEEAAKIEALKETLNIRTDADIAAISNQATQTKAAEEQQQQQQQNQIDQTTGNLNQTSQDNNPAPPPSGATGGGGGGGSGGHHGGGSYYASVNDVPGLIAALNDPYVEMITLTGNIDVTTGSAYALLPSYPNVLSERSQGYYNITIAAFKDIMVPSGKELKIHTSFSLDFGAYQGSGGGSISVQAGGTLDWKVSGLTLPIFAGSSPAAFQINNGWAFLGAMPMGIQGGVSKNWVYIENGANVTVNPHGGTWYDRIVIDETATLDINFIGTMYPHSEVRGTFNILENKLVTLATSINLTIHENGKLNVASGAGFDATFGSVIAMTGATITVVTGSSISGVSAPVNAQPHNTAATYEYDGSAWAIKP